MPSHAGDAPSWEALPVAEVQTRVDGAVHGLAQDEAVRRLARHGRNLLPRGKTASWAVLFLRQLRNPLVYILALAGAVSAIVGEVIDAAFIAAILLLNTVIGAVQEHRAEREMMALHHLLRTRAGVVRDGRPTEIDAEEVVPGDVVHLESGMRVPADLRLAAAHGLQVDESLLTGESLAVDKDSAWMAPGPQPVADRRNMAHAGSVVVHGRAAGIVVATGTGTEVGRIAHALASATTAPPPLVQRMARFSQAVAVAILAAVVLLGALGVAQGNSLQAMFFFGVALAVSAIPEGLPVAMTIVLTIASRRMAKRRVIIRRLPAVEGLGSCTYIASDKTGTLTQNELTVRLVRTAAGAEYDVAGVGFRPEGSLSVRPGSLPDAAGLGSLLEAAALCNEATLHQRDDRWAWQGDPTDVALLAVAMKHGLDRDDLLLAQPLEAQVPFEPERRYAATFHARSGASEDGPWRAVVKGAPERVVDLCHLDDDERRRRLGEAQAMAVAGYRVLAFAEGPSPALAPEDLEPGLAQRPQPLRFLGFAGMIDPLRPEARAAVHAARDAGIRIVMVTGDHPVTALAIGRDLGIAERADEVVTGSDVARLDAAGLQRAAVSARIFARMAPAQKLALVQAAQAAGHFVAVTGDGVNDAPALRAANIGVAMGKDGTDVAREASDVVLADDNFASIIGGVEEGRVAYDNIRKVIFLLISAGAAEIVLVFLALAFDSPLPLLPAQLLWLNIVTNGIQHIALAAEPKEGDVLSRAPRKPSERIFDRLMVERTIVAAAAMGVVGFGAFQWMLTAGWSEAAARNALLLLMVIFENVHLGNCRSETRSAFALSPLRNPVLVLAVVGAHLVHLGAMHLPILQRILRVEPVGLETWAVLAALSLTIVVAMELHKGMWWLRTRPQRGTATAAA